jgi:hypothetical protein
VIRPLLLGTSLSLFLAACSGSDEGAPGASAPQPAYPLDDRLRLNHLQAKGTHNSYHVETPGTTIEEHQYSHVDLATQLDAQGVRQVELDLHFDREEKVFLVYHLPVVDEKTTCRKLTECLQAMKTWSDAHRMHHPLFVQIEPKEAVYGDPETYFGLLEAEILSVWPRDRVIAPDDVKKDAPTVRDAVTEHGWPTLGESRGKIAFFVDNSSAFRDLYTHGGKDLDGRLMFVDAEPTDRFAGILILNGAIDDKDAIGDAVRAGFLVRTRADSDPGAVKAGDTATREAAFATGAHFVSTDFPAKVDGLSYSVEIPGGTPSRCNPLIAPAECTAQSIEDPAHLTP